jgi:hypothetical protein
MVFNNKIQIFSFSIQFISLKGKKKVVYIIERTFLILFRQNLNKISNIKNDVLCNVLNEVG